MLYQQITIKACEGAEGEEQCEGEHVLLLQNRGTQGAMTTSQNNHFGTAQLKNCWPLSFFLAS